MEYQVIDYKDDHQADFARLNYAWIEKYFEIEQADRDALEHPRQKIYNPGGHILLVQFGDEIVGTCALLKIEEKVFELAKMATDPDHQGKGLGYKLGLKIIEKAKTLGGRKLYLETNSQLTPAIHLYKKLGFKDTNDRPSPYCRCNVQMEMDLK